MMHRFLAFACLFAVLGCSPQPSAAPPASKINVTVPGVKVDVNKDQGSVDVDAPGVKIKVNPK